MPAGVGRSASNLVQLPSVGSSTERRSLFSDGVFLPRQNKEIHPASLLIFASILKARGSKRYSSLCFDFVHSLGPLKLRVA